MESTKLTTNQWKIYNLIKTTPNIQSFEIAQELGYEISFDSANRNLSRASAKLYYEIEKINQSPEIEKIIIWDQFNRYKLAENYDELFEFVNRLFIKPALKKLAKSTPLLKKAKLNGQCKLLSTKLDPIDDDSKARKFVESFMKEDE